MVIPWSTSVALHKAVCIGIHVLLAFLTMWEIISAIKITFWHEPTRKAAILTVSCHVTACGLVFRSTIVAACFNALLPEITILTAVKTSAIVNLTGFLAHCLVTMLTARTTCVLKEVPGCVAFTLTTLVVCNIHTFRGLACTVHPLKTLYACFTFPIPIAIFAS